MNLSIVTGVCGALDVTRRWVEETLGACCQPREVVVVSNGNTAEEVGQLRAMLPEAHLVELPEPAGSSAAFNAGWLAATGDVVAMLHNDLLVRQPGWDASVLSWFSHHPETGVAGFHGAQGLGAMDIYRTPYRLEQLARWNTLSNLEDAEAHGARFTVPTRVAVLDGLALIARRADLETWGGLDETYVHHMYDSDLCLQAMAAGRVNYMLPIRCRHLNGQTANASRYQEWARPLGMDVGIHARSHRIFYERWRGRLPVLAR